MAKQYHIHFLKYIFSPSGRRVDSDADTTGEEDALSKVNDVHFCGMEISLFSCL